MTDEEYNILMGALNLYLEAVWRLLPRDEATKIKETVDRIKKHIVAFDG